MHLPCEGVDGTGHSATVYGGKKDYDSTSQQANLFIIHLLIFQQ